MADLGRLRKKICPTNSHTEKSMGSLGLVLRDHGKNHEVDQIEQMFRASQAINCTLMGREVEEGKH